MLEDRFSSAIASVSRGLIVGTAFGDAFGIPYENRTFNELQLLRKCWIGQVLHQHPELVEFQRIGTDSVPSVAGGEGGDSAQQEIDELLRQQTSSSDLDFDGGAGGGGLSGNKLGEDDGPKSSGSRNSNNRFYGNSNNGGGGSTPKHQVLQVPAPRSNTGDAPSSLNIMGDGGGNNADAGAGSGNLASDARTARLLDALDYAPVMDHPFIPEGFKVGMWTDDTQLTCAMARALASSLSSSSDQSLSKKQRGGDVSSAAAATSASQSSRHAATRRARADDDALLSETDDRASLPTTTTNSSSSSSSSSAAVGSGQVQAAGNNNLGRSSSSSSAVVAKAAATTTAIDGDVSKQVSKRIRFFHIAQEHVVEHQRTLDGWGGTRAAIERLIRPVEETKEAMARADASMPESQRNMIMQMQQQQQQQALLLDRFNAHRASGNANAIGNGVLMKLTPLAVVLGVEASLVRRQQQIQLGQQQQQQQQQSGSREDVRLQRMSRIGAREKLVLELTRMTHGSGDAVATAIVHNEMLMSIFEDWFTNVVLSPGKFHQHHYSPSSASPSSLQQQQQQQRRQVGDDESSAAPANDGDPSSAAPGSGGGGGGGKNSSNGNSSDASPPSSSSPATEKFDHRSGIPIFDRVRSSGKRAALVAAMFHVALERGISFCQEMSSEDINSTATSRGGGKNNNNNNNNSNAGGDGDDDMAARSASTDSTVAAATTLHGYPDSFAKIGQSLTKVRDFFMELQKRHQDLGEEEWVQGDIFPFISSGEREQIEQQIVAVSNGGTFHCTSSFVFVWAYLCTFAPCCAVSCARPDIIPTAIAHSALLGGDSDSNASMIGGVLGGLFGSASIEPFVKPVQHPEVINEAVRCMECSLGSVLNSATYSKY